MHGALSNDENVTAQGEQERDSKAALGPRRQRVPPEQSGTGRVNEALLIEPGRHTTPLAVQSPDIKQRAQRERRTERSAPVRFERPKREVSAAATRKPFVLRQEE